MDANKLKVLQDIDYTVQKSCMLCVHFVGYTWGTCDRHEYEHLKHTERLRELTVHASGICKHFEEDHTARPHLGKFAQFLSTSKE